MRSDRYGNATGGNSNWNDDSWNDMPGSLDERVSWLKTRVDRLESRGRLTRADARYARNELSQIEYQHRTFMRDGRLSAREEVTVRNRLDRVQERVRAARQQARNY